VYPNYLRFVNQWAGSAMKQERVETIQTAVRIPRAMLGRLQQSDLGVSEEIRRRLARTFAEDAIDPITRELLTGIVNLAAGVQADLGTPWHSYRGVQEVFAAAVALRLAAYKPVHKSPMDAFMQLARNMGLSDQAASQIQQAPDAVGAVIERSDRRANTYEHLQHFQTERTDRDSAKRARSLSSAMRAKKEKKEE
jgi:hypothetical protein